MNRKRAGVVAGIAAVAVLATAGIAVAATGALSPTEDPDRAASAPSTPLDPATAAPRDTADAEREFLDDWVEDGRVVRRDQGGDTVSEGQAYGLLVALAADDEESFDRIWDWTTTNLQRTDGLLAWRWSDGAVVDDEPASDADLDTARALALAGDRWSRDDLTTDATALAGVIADRLTVETAAGRILLPGMWAAATQPYAYNPSYPSPVAFAVLFDLTGDERWNEVAAGSRAVTSSLLDTAPLPSDWARVNADGTVAVAAGPAESAEPVRYGYDAARMPIRFAESCDPEDVALSARLLPALTFGEDLTAQLDLGGSSLTTDRHPLAFGARAAVLAADGDTAGAEADLSAGDTLAQEQQTYYGSAWAALAPALLTATDLGGCPPITA
ncbi:glycosyl hydrolase family 8 [Amnibacterium flavum]|uniref:Glycoside hydrolase n=1 Tax=Amnibacterium flavum TaxID=2173173 RepID=A0A2V1HMW7_9MICO|nr:glycosyl hydrolase family 8 [Amnibacterium flavum]PVZ93946.1 glycoside hydrolase [Amnibacterium flavum]